MNNNLQESHKLSIYIAYKFMWLKALVYDIFILRQSG